jgi:hypothetical protein
MIKTESDLSATILPEPKFGNFFFLIFFYLKQLKLLPEGIFRTRERGVYAT